MTQVRQYGITRASMRLGMSMDRLEAAMARAEELLTVNASKLDFAAKTAADKCYAMLQGFLSQNLAAAGIKPTSRNKKASDGNRIHLHDFAKEIYLRGRWDRNNNRPRIYVQMPAGYSDDMYKQAIALSYGSVRGVAKKVRDIRDLPSQKLVRVGMESAIGSSAKRTLKKILYKQRVGNRARTQLEKGSSFYGTSGVSPTNAGKTKAGSFITGSGIIVTQARPWLQMTPSQAEAIYVAFSKFFNDEISKNVGTN